MTKHTCTEFIARSVVIEEAFALIVDKNAAVRTESKRQHDRGAGSNVRMNLDTFKMCNLGADRSCELETVTMTARLSRTYHAEELGMIFRNKCPVVGIASCSKNDGFSLDFIKTGVFAFN